METLLTILEKAGAMPNMGAGKMLVCIQQEPFAIFNAEVLDPWLGLLRVEGKNIYFTQKQTAECMASFVDD